MKNNEKCPKLFPYLIGSSSDLPPFFYHVFFYFGLAYGSTDSNSLKFQQRACFYSNLCLCSGIVTVAGQENCGIWPQRLRGNAKRIVPLVKTM